MRRTLNRLLSTAAIVLAGLSLAGCKQAAGEYCEVTSDCEAPLMCVTTAGASGYCSASPAPAPLLDAAAQADGSGSTTDGPLPGPDLGGPDVASTSDAITPDAPAPADLAADATPDLARDTAPVTPDSSSQ